MRCSHFRCQVLCCLILVSTLLLPPVNLDGAPAGQSGQQCRVSDFRRTVYICDSLLKRKCESTGFLMLKEVWCENSSLTFDFTVSLSDYPLRPGYDKWLKSTISKNLPKKYRGLKVEKILCEGRSIDSLLVNVPGNSGHPAESSFRTTPSSAGSLYCRGKSFRRGLSGRNIAIWNSHGSYFKTETGTWEWQRPLIFGSREDLSTWGYVEPFLCPMLENAGASVIVPRERDPHTQELIMDNDGGIENSPEYNCGRSYGRMLVHGKWKQAGGGFRDCSQVYFDDTPSPFGAGTCLYKAGTKKKDEADSIQWEGNIRQRGTYAVYVSYKTFSGSSSAAKYTVHRLGADETVLVNQKMASGTWVYIGSYEFGAGEQVLVSLSSHNADGGVVSADAVKIGGGMGCSVRVDENGDTSSVSGIPRAWEGSRYYLKWSGAPNYVWNKFSGKDDYTDDYSCRGPWVGWLTGGSKFNPKAAGCRIPVDLAMAFHTDAGERKNHGIVGTLSIYTLMEKKVDTLPSGVHRSTCRELSDFVQTEVVGDIKAEWDPQWKRRMLWNRNYSESRTTKVPTVLLELLSHQNFEDMKYGMDPAFRFTVARACYKGMLKYLAMHYGKNYTVQPLPVKDFRAVLGGDEAILEWKSTADSREPTAKPEGYILYTRIDSCGWDAGEDLGNVQKIRRKIRPAHVHSYRIVAYNAGGLSFPSETMSVGLARRDSSSSEDKKVLIVNGFTRISGPAWYESENGGDFERYVDSGVPYVSDLSCGGNTFDYTAVHGGAILKAGYSFESCAVSVFNDGGCDDAKYFAIDLIYGKQCRYRAGLRSSWKEGCFPQGTRQALYNAARKGSGIIVSGSYIASDAYHRIYGNYGAGTVEKDSAVCNFCRDALGYSLERAYAGRSGKADFVHDGTGRNKSDTCLNFAVKPNTETYCVESPDALCPDGKNARGSKVYLRYSGKYFAAGLWNNTENCRCAVFGFPLELIKEESLRERVFEESLRWISGVEANQAQR